MTRYRRTGVEPAAGLLLALPIWFWTRLRWQLGGNKSWDVEVSTASRSGIGRLVDSRSYVDRSKAEDALEQVRRDVDDRAFDRFLG